MDAHKRREKKELIVKARNKRRSSCERLTEAFSSFSHSGHSKNPVCGYAVGQAEKWQEYEREREKKNTHLQSWVGKGDEGGKSQQQQLNSHLS